MQAATDHLTHPTEALQRAIQRFRCGDVPRWEMEQRAQEVNWRSQEWITAQGLIETVEAAEARAAKGATARPGFRTAAVIAEEAAHLPARVLADLIQERGDGEIPDALAPFLTEARALLISRALPVSAITYRSLSHVLPREGEEHHADVVPGVSIRLYGKRKDYSRAAPVSGALVDYDQTFRVGDYAEYGSYNLTYTGPISSITAKTVSVRKGSTGSRGARRFTIDGFSNTNHDYNADEIAKRNADWRD